ncbi:serpin family protein [Olsenella sp. DSM 107455]|uniref:Serpin family protein n=1 Tax=Thermophilibacter gallinarum TaxID=2779357 RepID=A0ABR9QTI9_9ACTN|nr:serpin family protein [Thermophilibacter gallinarum]MBE5024408.1 serpin family protein [Thermophilibacter gallinarum]
MTRRILGIVASALTAASLLVGCGGNNLTATELTAGIEPAGAASLEVGEGADTYDFALGLLRESTGEESTLVSPLSVLSALALAESGADGATLAQMEQVTGMSVDELTDALQAYGMLDDDEALSLANSVWLKDGDGLEVESDFLETCAGQLGAQVFSAPFDDSTVDDVNAWISEKTHEMIPQMLNQISGDTQVLLVNALAFEGGWEDPFDSELTSPDTFTREDGTERDVTMMRSTENDYLESELATGFIKPYEGYDYAFVGLLPAEGTTVDELLASLDGAALEELLTPVDGAGAEIGLLKFTATYEAELGGALRALGMTDAFDGNLADFSRMGTSDKGPLAVGGVLHKTFIDVNEEGTRAAAATVIPMDGVAAPGGPIEYHEVILDRPFVYLIMDLRCDLPVFAGTYMG